MLVFSSRGTLSVLEFDDIKRISRDIEIEIKTFIYNKNKKN